MDVNYVDCVRPTHTAETQPRGPSQPAALLRAAAAAAGAAPSNASCVCYMDSVNYVSESETINVVYVVLLNYVNYVKSL